MRDLTRPELVTEAVRAALEKVARTAGHLLVGLTDEDWGRRYGHPVRLGKNPTRPKTRILAAGDDACRLLERLPQVATAHHRLALVWADGGYTGNLIKYGLTVLALVLAIVKRSDDMRGFVVLPKRWIVERFFAHLMRSRRLVRDFERSTGSAEAMVHWSMTLLMTRRLARPRPSRA
ncbi:hypothetical protein GCM10010495_80770 [Kitasatospora herbaricolor]|uniref:transposase n=1 Tax=Kitasatospora herbaricolor TaxID=68217 RepID=UPI00199BE5E6|nr:transposase [Kitasatospora herbaricolor]MDQ0305860.1 transposase [Kitasatospora herbaricolor]GGV50987.1 hypothetical protein GCM10010495_80770 [Kitasatospora herbaricolor]